MLEKLCKSGAPVEEILEKIKTSPFTKNIDNYQVKKDGSEYLIIIEGKELRDDAEESMNIWAFMDNGFVYFLLTHPDMKTVKDARDWCNDCWNF